MCENTLRQLLAQDILGRIVAVICGIRKASFQNFKFAKESPTWRNLGKQIINVLASEKMTKDIEDGQTDGNENEVIGMEVHLRTTNSLKEINVSEKNSKPRLAT